MGARTACISCIVVTVCLILRTIPHGSANAQEASCRRLVLLGSVGAGRAAGTDCVWVTAFAML